MKSLWHPEAKRAMLDVAHYIQVKFGTKARMEFLSKVRNEENLLRHSPNIGLIDPLFDDRSITYRSVIINGLNKMFFYVEDNTLHIAGFWATRSEPKAQASQVK